jgi:hypothetical protein
MVTEAEHGPGTLADLARKDGKLFLGKIFPETGAWQKEGNGEFL